MAGNDDNDTDEGTAFPGPGVCLELIAILAQWQGSSGSIPGVVFFFLFRIFLCWSGCLYVLFGNIQKSVMLCAFGEDTLRLFWSCL